MRNSGYHHREYTIIWRISWEFSVDPVTDASESECDRYDDSESIYESPELVLIPLRKKKHGKYSPEESSMEAHPTFPDPYHLEWMLYEV